MAVKKTTTTGKETQQTAQQAVTSGTATGTSTVSVPDWLKPFLKQDVATGSQALQTAAQGVNAFQVPQETLDTLKNYASGGFLYGGPEQEAYMRAQMDAVTPNIIQGFGGRGGNPLAAQAATRSGQNAFANLFPQEQAFQLQAANALPNMQMLPLQLQFQLAQQGMQAPGQLSPLFGQNTSSTTTGTTNTLGSMTGKTSSVTAEPLYQTPWWQTALGAVGAGAGLLGSLNPTTGIGSAIKSAVPFAGGLVGAFR